MLLKGDCLEVLRTIPDNSVDSIVCDPPYHLTSIVKRFGGKTAAPAQHGKDGAFARASAGFMGKQWDGGDIAFRVELWEEVLRVLKPGGHLIAFSSTRTYHRMACAIEDAGFEIRDQIGWAYGSGFPKSHDVERAINKAAGVEYEAKPASGVGFMGPDGPGGYNVTKHQLVQSGESTPEAAQWQGWGTALKPAWEPICLARKPLIGTVAENVLEYGTGAINIDGCRIDAIGYTNGGQNKSIAFGMNGLSEKQPRNDGSLGRWPTNVIHDGSEEVLAAFPDAPGQQQSVGPEHGAKASVNVYGDYGPRDTFAPRGDTGSAARFFYTAKADAEDRLGSKHPTVKPLDLMQYLVRLVTPKGGTVLDPFAGTGTTGEAAWREGMNAILIEREEEYQADIARRMDLADKPSKRAAVAATKNNLEDPQDLPLFSIK